jgi:hypothetical protein
MITKRKVLILGAGASIPIGFPSGLQLVEEICNGLLRGDICNFFEQSLGFSDHDITMFRSALADSRVPSVDQFLELQPQFLGIGKAAISAALIPKEQPHALFPKGGKIKQSWYDYLLNAVRCNKRQDFDQNRLAIITYNYDRSVEYFLIRSIANSYGLTLEQARECLSCIPIVHLHGLLGELALTPGEAGRPYVNTLSADAIRKSAAQIRVVHEEITETYEKAMCHLQQAEEVCFLGFGYNPTNVQRLRLDAWPNAKVFGTTYHITDAERTKVHEQCLNGRGIVFGKEDEEVLPFLRRWALLP